MRGLKKANGKNNEEKVQCEQLTVCTVQPKLYTSPPPLYISLQPYIQGGGGAYFLVEVSSR